MNSSGKVLTIFLVITAILLISLTAISLFFFQKEIERRKETEVTLDAYKEEKIKLEENLKEAKKQNFLLQEKNKEANERVDDLSDELELAKGLREEMKLETDALTEELEELKKEKEEFSKSIEEKEELYEKLTEEFSASEQKIKELEAQLKAEVERSQKLGELYKEQQAEVSKLTESQAQQAAKAQEVQDNELEISDEEVLDDVVSMGVELEEIVVFPGSPIVKNSISDFLSEESNATLKTMLDGRILSVDLETEFVIVSLGKKDGLKVGHILSVYRNENYMGDIKITRLQSEMSAADLVQPLSIRSLKKNDQVKTK